MSLPRKGLPIRMVDGAYLRYRWLLKVAEEAGAGVGGWKDRVRRLEVLVSTLSSKLFDEFAYLYSGLNRVEGRLRRVEESVSRLTEEVGSLRSRVERGEARIEDVGESLGRIEESLQALTRDLEEVRGEVAKMLLARGEKRSPVVSKYLADFARSLALTLTEGEEEIAREIADSSVEVGSPVRRIRPIDFAEALTLLRVYREGGRVREEDVNRLVRLGLVKRVPGGIAPTRLLRGLCALALSQPVRSERSRRRSRLADLFRPSR